MISVIVPVYKVERYLRQCIDSILNQTYRDLEILLIDDGSPDRCGEICEEYARKDDRIRFFHMENNGLSAARNLGLREAKGDYIGFVDSDDWIEPDMYENLLKQLEGNEADISVCGVWKEYRETKCDYSICEGVYIGSDAIRVLICQLTSGVWNRLYKKDCWTGIFFPEKHVYEEIATSYKVFLQAHSISCMPKQFYHYRMRAGSIDHMPSMNNLMDCWNSYYERYLYLKTIPSVNNDQELIDCLKKRTAFVAGRIWRLVYGIPKKQNDYDFLRTVSGFMRSNFHLFEKKNWRVPLCIYIFFSRYTSEFSFAILHVLNGIYSFFKYRNKTLFPS